MRILHRILFALRSVVKRNKFEQEMREELADFLERDIQQRLKGGVTRDTAQRSARAELRAQQTLEIVRDLRPGIWLEDLWWDLRICARTLMKRPAYFAIALATMALGIGANTAIFSLLHAVLLQPLPFHEPDRLAFLQTQTRDALVPQVAFPDFIDIRNQHRGIESATLFLYDAFVLHETVSGPAVRKSGLRVDANFFRTLGVHPAIGRSFTQQEMFEGNDRVAVISHRLWKEEFEVENRNLGTEIILNEQSYTVIGVMPPRFDLFLPMTDSFVIQDTDIYVPLTTPPEYVQHRSVFTMEAIARLRQNAGLQQAQTEIRQISRRLAAKYPETNSGRSLMITPLREHVTAETRPALLLLMGAVTAMLLVACANLANLMIGRVVAREQELSVCSALGATPGRLLRRLLIESILIVALGGITGMILARLLLPQITERLASRLPGVDSIGLNVPVLLFAVIIMLVTGLICGLLPARSLWRTGNSSGDTRATYGGGHARIRKGLVITEIALSCSLLAGAFLLATSFLSLMHVPTGFDSGKLLTFKIRLSESRYETRKQVAQTVNEFTQRIAALPDVGSAAATSSLPLSGHNTGTSVWIAGKTLPGDTRLPEARWQFVEPAYFETMRIPLLSGRYFDLRDLEHDRHVTLISQSAAQRYFANENPIGKRVSYGPPGEQPDWHEIIGVVGDVRHGSLREDPVPRVYDLLGQHADLGLFVVVRTDTTASNLIASIRIILSQIDAGAPIYGVRTMQQWKARSVDREQTLATLVAFFALAALFLGAVGAYGVISSLVAQRTREIGIRIAVGAAPQRILRATIQEGLRLSIAGLAIGLLTFFLLAPMLRGILYGVHSADPRMIAAVIVTLLLIALVACYVPARRASRIDPVIALRQE